MYDAPDTSVRYVNLKYELYLSESMVNAACIERDRNDGQSCLHYQVEHDLNRTLEAVNNVFTRIASQIYIRSN